MPAKVPTLGYPSQREAVIALYEQRVLPQVIAEMTLLSNNVVHRAIHNYRTKTGRIIAPDRSKPTAAPQALFDDSAYGRALRAHQRAVQGARKTLEAAGL